MVAQLQKACHTCGRVISSRANTRTASASGATAAKASKKGSTERSPITEQQESKYCSLSCKQDKPKVFDRAIESAFLTQLHDRRAEAAVRKAGVLCTEVEAQVFGESRDHARRRREHGSDGESPAAAMETETPAERGMREAKQRERVRRAGRRLVAFGVPESLAQDTIAAQFRDRAFDCVQEGKPVEPSFAKGDWGVRVKD